MSDRLKKSPDGGNVRRRPWDEAGMSRTTWYRHGQPTADYRDFYRQEARARMMGASKRSVQRISFSKHVREAGRKKAEEA